jgi:hypothetical protein
LLRLAHPMESYQACRAIAGFPPDYFTSNSVGTCSVPSRFFPHMCTRISRPIFQTQDFQVPWSGGLNCCIGRSIFPGCGIRRSGWRVISVAAYLLLRIAPFFFDGSTFINRREPEGTSEYLLQVVSTVTLRVGLSILSDWCRVYGVVEILIATALSDHYASQKVHGDPSSIS